MPAITSSAALQMAEDSSGANRPYFSFTFAAHFFRMPKPGEHHSHHHHVTQNGKSGVLSADCSLPLITWGGMRLAAPPILKFCSERWVCAPHSLSLGTSTSPIVSASTRMPDGTQAVVLTARAATVCTPGPRAPAQAPRPSTATVRIIVLRE